MALPRLERQLKSWGWGGFGVILISYCVIAALVLLLWNRQGIAIQQELEKYTRTEALVQARLLLFDMANDPRMERVHRLEVMLGEMGAAPADAVPPELFEAIQDKLEWPDTELWKRAEALGMKVSVKQVTAARAQLYRRMLEASAQDIEDDLAARITFSDNLRGIRMVSTWGTELAVGEPVQENRLPPANEAIRGLPEGRLMVALPLTVSAYRWGMVYLLMERTILVRLTSSLLGTLRESLWFLALLMVLFALAWAGWWALLLAKVRNQVVTPIVALARRMEEGAADVAREDREESEPEWLARAFDGLMRRSAEQREQLLRAQRMGLLERIGAGLSHEINNALNPIRLRLDEISLEGRAASSDDVRALREYLSHAQRVLKDLTSAVKHPGSPMRNVEPDEWLPIVRRLVEPQFPTPANLDWSVDAAAPSVWGDPQWLIQSSVNLILNARDAVDSLGIFGRVQVRFGPGSGGGGDLSVADNGPGIPPEVAQHLFEPFVTSKVKGTGLGLFVVDHLVRRMGGLVRLESAPAGGCIARMSLLGEPRSGEKKNDG